jgi:hypothetical protein
MIEKQIIQKNPFRIGSFDEGIFPASLPPFDFFFSGYSVVDIIKNFKVN